MRGNPNKVALVIVIILAVLIVFFIVSCTNGKTPWGKLGISINRFEDLYQQYG